MNLISCQVALSGLWLACAGVTRSAELLEPWRLEAGPLVLDVQVSKTAHLFHVVDQISRWSEFCHRQYVSYFEGLEGGLSPRDHERLAEHVKVRRVRGWGSSLEKTFYTPLDLETALQQAVKAGWLTESEAQTERRVFQQFEARIERLMAQEQATLEGFRRHLASQHSNLAATANTLARFVGATNLTVPVFLMANPDDYSVGGGYNGERLTIEIARKVDVYPSFLHEIFHAFLRTQQPAMKKAASSVPGLDEGTLSEGLAYAFNPGLVRAGGRDSLLVSVADYLAKGSPLEDAYTRYHLYGLALRPLLKEALADPGQDFNALLPRALDAWRVLAELDQARTAKNTTPAHDYRKDPKHSTFIFGLWDEEANRGLKEPNRPYIFGRNHLAGEYEKMLTQHAKAGDTIVLLLSLDDVEGRVPAAYADLLPLPWPEVKSRLESGQRVFQRGQAREMIIYLIAAPGAAELRQEFRRLAAGNKLGS